MYQTNWIQIRADFLSSLIWVQTVCKAYQQTTFGGNELKGTATLKANDKKCMPFLNHTFCHKPDQNRMKIKNVTNVCREED